MEEEHKKSEKDYKIEKDEEELVKVKVKWRA